VSPDLVAIVFVHAWQVITHVRGMRPGAGEMVSHQEPFGDLQIARTTSTPSSRVTRDGFAQTMSRLVDQGRRYMGWHRRAELL
jgi:hypothetical protein